MDNAFKSNSGKLLEEYSDVLNPEDIQKILRTGRNSVYAMLKSNEIPSLKIGGKYRIPKLYILQYMYPDLNLKAALGGTSDGQA